MGFLRKLGSGLGLAASDEEIAAQKRMKQAGFEQARRRGRVAEQVDESRGAYRERLDSFDPQSYMKEAAGAVGSELYEQLGQVDAARRRGHNARGLMPGSPMGMGNQSRDFNTRLARATAGLAMQAGQMEQGKIDRYGDLHSEDRGYEEQGHQTYLDLLAGDRDYEGQRRRDRLGTTMGVARVGMQAAGMGA